MLAAAAGFGALAVHTGVPRPGYAAVAVFAFALIYLAVGVLVGSVIADPLEGSLAGVFLFLLGVFSGAGMAAHAGARSFSRKAADVLITAAGGGSPTVRDWLPLGAVAGAAVAVAFAVFCFAARRRT